MTGAAESPSEVRGQSSAAAPRSGGGVSPWAKLRALGHAVACSRHRTARRWDDALRQARARHQLDASDASARMVLGQVYWRLGFFDDTWATVEPLQQDRRWTKKIHSLMALLHEERREHAAARVHHRVLTTLSRNPARHWMQIGHAYACEARLEEARRAYRQAVEWLRENPSGPSHAERLLEAERQLAEPSPPPWIRLEQLVPFEELRAQANAPGGTPPPRRKLFGIGLSKTGTTSLTEAFEGLGYRSEHFIADLDRIRYLGGATDVQIARAYRELDRRYPGSRFILTVRDETAWLDSARRHFQALGGGSRVKLRSDLYGASTFDARTFRRGLRRHHEGVRRHFAQRPDDLLELDICGGQGWPELCAFLGVPIPTVPWPHLNRRERVEAAD